MTSRSRSSGSVDEVTRAERPPSAERAGSAENPQDRFDSLRSLGPVLLGAGLAVQLTLAAVLLVEPPEQDRSLLTGFGTLHFHPERDFFLYLASIGAALLVIVASVAWNRRGRSVHATATSAGLRALALQLVVAVTGTALSVNQYFEARTFVGRRLPVPPVHGAVFAAVVVVSIAAAFWDRFPGPRARDRGWARNVRQQQPEVSLPGWRWSPVDLIVPAVIAATVYVPGWREMAGQFMLVENLGHWDYFIMAPALAFHHGMDLGTDVSAMYGVGWPMAFGALFSWMEPSFGRMIQIASIYTCIYLSGIYLLLRLLIRRPGMAAFGTALVATHLFLGQGDSGIWRFPSMTVMRSAFDVWCFVALVLHWKAGRRVWAAAAGVFTGLAIAFGTDTGLCLAAAGGFYWLGILRITDDRRRGLKDLLAFGTLALSTLLAALLISAHGRIFLAAFWRGWLESIFEFGQGFIGVPLSTGPGAGTLLTFVVLLFLYTAFFGIALAGVISGRTRRVEVFNGFLAFYGLLAMLQFVGKSDRFHYRLGIPLVIILCTLAGRGYERAGSWIQLRWGKAARKRALLALSITVVVSAGLIAALAPSTLVQPIRLYHGPASTWFGESRPGGPCLMLEPRDICGLSAELLAPAAEFREVSRQLSDLTKAGNSVAVISETGSLPYLASNSAPWGRYPRLFVSVFTKRKLAELGRSLERDRPDYVFMRVAAVSELMRTSGAEGEDKAYSDQDYRELYRAWVFGPGPTPESPYADTWRELRSVVHESYRLERTTVAYEVWKLKPSETAGRS